MQIVTVLGGKLKKCKEGKKAINHVFHQSLIATKGRIAPWSKLLLNCKPSLTKFQPL